MALFCSASPYKKAVALELFQVDQTGASLKAVWGLVGSNHCRGLGLSPQDKEDNKEKESLLVLSTLVTVVSILLQKIMKKKKTNLVGNIGMLESVET